MNQSALDFLKDLSKNNNREWFHANKKRYEADLKKPFQAFIQNIIDALQAVDPEIKVAPKDCIFRINRDIRFSKDKSPYKTNVGALISRYGRKAKELPGFYVHLEPGRLMLGGGAYFVDNKVLYQVRQYIIFNLERFQQLANAPTFLAKYEEGIKGEKNKRLPKEFQEVLVKEPLLANKQFYYMAEMEPQHALKEDAIRFIVDYFKTAHTLNQFLEEAMQFEQKA